MSDIPIADDEYDFDDDFEVDEETPDAGGPFVLRVIKGIAAGGEMPLEAARYRIGSAPDCDIVLTDDEIAEVHMDCVFADGVLSVLRANGPFSVAGRVVEDLPLDIQQLDVIIVGNTALAYGPEDSEGWPDPDHIVLPSEREEDTTEGGEIPSDKDENTVPAADAEGAEANAHAGAGAEDEPSAGEGSVATSDGDAGETAEETGEAARKSFLKRHVRLIAAMAVVIVIGVGAVGYVSFKNEDTNASLPETPEQQVEDRMRELRRDIGAVLTSKKGYRFVKLVQSDNGFRLEGFVDDPEAFDNLRKLAREKKVRFSVNSVSSLQTLVDDAISKIMGIRAEVRLSAKGEPEVQLTGLFNTDDDQKTAIQRILQNLPQLKSNQIRNAALVKTSVVLAARLLIRQTPALETVEVSFLGDNLVLQGDLLGNFSAPLESTIGAIVNATGSKVKVVNQVNMLPTFTASVVSLLFGAKPAVKLRRADGQVVTMEVGDSLANGLTIAAIDKVGLAFIYQGATALYPIDYARIR